MKKDDGKWYIIKADGTELNGIGYDTFTIYTNNHINVGVGNDYYTLDEEGNQGPIRDR